MFDIDTNWGQIHFSKDIIYRICMDAVDSCKGRVVIYNFRGKGRGKGETVLQPRKGRAVHDDIHIEGSEEALLITIYIVIGFGDSIKGSAEHIINSIFDKLKDVFGVTPAKVTVINTGTASRDVIGRHMEFYRTSRSDEIVEA